MAIGREDIHMYFRFKDFINHPVFLCYLSRPLTRTITSQWFRMTRTSLGMFFQFFQKTKEFIKRLRFMTLKPISIFKCLSRKDDNITHLPIRLRKSLKLSPGNIA